MGTPPAREGKKGEWRTEKGKGRPKNACPPMHVLFGRRGERRTEKGKRITGFKGLRKIVKCAERAERQSVQNSFPLSPICVSEYHEADLQKWN